jgi:hypothetical protein
VTAQVVIDKDGTHTFRDQGYSPPHFAHLYVCDEHGCRTIARTDEFKAEWLLPRRVLTAVLPAVLP